MTDLHTLTTPRRVSLSRYEVNVPDGWQQGRGAFGGFVIASLIRALEADNADPERTLRSLTAELCGPVMLGPAQIAVEVLRRGSGVTTLAARLTQGSDVLAHAVGVFGRARADKTQWLGLEAPPRSPWRTVEPLQLGELGPAFTRFFDLRSVGPLPYSGSPQPIASGWIRPKEPGPGRGAAYIAACADAWWPATFATDSAPRPVGTLAYTLELLGTCEGLDPEAPLFHRARVVAGGDGYIVEFRELWGEDGRLIALNQQTIALIR